MAVAFVPWGETQWDSQKVHTVFKRISSVDILGQEIQNRDHWIPKIQMPVSKIRKLPSCKHMAELRVQTVN